MASSLAVILPTCNRFALLKRTLLSLERQTYKDFTVYVSDDLSTDETKDHDANSFSNLKIHWIKRTKKFPGIAEHFSALYTEATEDWIALAHDDEVYAPEWLETLVGMMQQSTPDSTPIVMAQVGTVVIDARRGKPQYYKRADQIPDGLYTGNGLKRMCLFDGRHFATNGYLVTREAARATGAFNPDYEQFDFEWLMRLAQLGLTACSTRLLHTYCMHPQNTVGSAQYLRRYFEQKNPSVMELEWLESARDVSLDQITRRRDELKSNVERSRFHTFLKAVATGNRELVVDMLAKIEKKEAISFFRRRMARGILTPIFFDMISKSLSVILEREHRQKHRNLLVLDSVETWFYAKK